MSCALRFADAGRISCYINWAVKELNLSYHNPQTVLFGVYIYIYP